MQNISNYQIIRLGYKDPLNEFAPSNLRAWLFPASSDPCTPTPPSRLSGLADRSGVSGVSAQREAGRSSKASCGVASRGEPRKARLPQGPEGMPGGRDGCSDLDF